MTDNRGGHHDDLEEISRWSSHRGCYGSAVYDSGGPDLFWRLDDTSGPARPPTRWAPGFEGTYSVGANRSAGAIRPAPRRRCSAGWLGLASSAPVTPDLGVLRGAVVQHHDDAAGQAHRLRERGRRDSNNYDRHVYMFRRASWSSASGPARRTSSGRRRPTTTASGTTSWPRRSPA